MGIAEQCPARGGEWDRFLRLGLKYGFAPEEQGDFDLVLNFLFFSFLVCKMGCEDFGFVCKAAGGGRYLVTLADGVLLRGVLRCDQ